MALNCSDMPLPKMWLQGLSVCLSTWEMSVLGSSFGAWDSPGSGQTPGGCSDLGGCSDSRGGLGGAGQEEGSAWKKSLLDSVQCYPSTELMGYLQWVQVWLRPWAGVNGAVPVPWLSWDVDNAVTRPPSRARHSTQRSTRSN